MNVDHGALNGCKAFINAQLGTSSYKRIGNTGDADKVIK